MLRSLGRDELRRHRLVLDLLVLRLELRVGFVGGKRLDVRETLLVLGGLRGEPRDIRRRLFAIRFQYFGVLLCGGERRL